MAEEVVKKEAQEAVLPHNIEAEKSVLGAILLNNESLIDALGYIDTSDFYLRAHQLIFQAMKELNDEKKNIDPVTLGEKLERKHQLEEVGDIPYLTELSYTTPTAANINYYANIVEERSALRSLIREATIIQQKSYEQNVNVTDLLDEASSRIMKVSEHRDHQAMRKVGDIMSNVMVQIEEMSKQNGMITGLSTGYPALDRMTTGLHEDELIVLAARPGVGKTAFALNIVQNVAVTQHLPVAIFSLEMGGESLVMRMIASQGMIPNYHLRSGQLTDEEWIKLGMCFEELSKADIYIDDTPGIKISEIRAKCKRVLQENPDLGLIVIDYLQLIEGGGKENRQQEVSYISRQLKKLAKELHVPVLALSQLSRGIEQRNDKRPMLSDIRESGAIEQDADIVAFLHQERTPSGDIDEEEETTGEDQLIEVLIEKNRSGSRGSVQLAFIKEYGRFLSVSTREDG